MPLRTASSRAASRSGSLRPAALPDDVEPELRAGGGRELQEVGRGAAPGARAAG